MTDQDYQRTVLRGIPSELATFASALLSAHSITAASRPTMLATNTLISHICEEADRLKNRRARTGNSNGTKDPLDEALTVTEGDVGTKKKRKGKCRNCGKPGHWERVCRASQRQGSTDSIGDSGSGAQAAAPTSTSITTPPHPSGRVETRPVGTANAACFLDDGDGVWAVEVAFPTFDSLLFSGGLRGPVIGSEAYQDPLEQPLEGTTSLVDNEGYTVDDSDGLWGDEEAFPPPSTRTHSMATYQVRPPAQRGISPLWSTS